MKLCHGYHQDKMSNTFLKSLHKDRDTANDCCFFDLEKDPGENYPKEVDCNTQLDIAIMLYDNKKSAMISPQFAIRMLPTNKPPIQMSTAFGVITEQVAHSLTKMESPLVKISA
jgi:hypothetical protein